MKNYYGVIKHTLACTSILSIHTIFFCISVEPKFWPLFDASFFTRLFLLFTLLLAFSGFLAKLAGYVIQASAMVLCLLVCFKRTLKKAIRLNESDRFLAKKLLTKTDKLNFVSNVLFQRVMLTGISIRALATLVHRKLAKSNLMKYLYYFSSILAFSMPFGYFYIGFNGAAYIATSLLMIVYLSTFTYPAIIEAIIKRSYNKNRHNSNYFFVFAKTFQKSENLRVQLYSFVYLCLAVVAAVSGLSRFHYLNEQEPMTINCLNDDKSLYAFIGSSATGMFLIRKSDSTMTYISNDCGLTLK